MDWIIVLVGGIGLMPLLILGIILLTGRGAFLVAGYNTMSPREKAGWNEKALCRFTGCIILLFSALLLVSLVFVSFGNMMGFTVFFVLGLAEILAGVLYANLSRRFKR